jgi:alpha-glucosidase
MVWDAARTHAGFSDAERTWLPLAPEHLFRAAAAQRRDPASLLNRYRDTLAWRREQPLLRHGAMELLPVDDSVLAFVRRDAETGAAMLCAFNLSGDTARYELPPGCRVVVLDVAHPLPAATLSGRALLLPPCGAAFAKF